MVLCACVVYGFSFSADFIIILYFFLLFTLYVPRVRCIFLINWLIVNYICIVRSQLSVRAWSSDVETVCMYSCAQIRLRQWDGCREDEEQTGRWRLESPPSSS